MGEERLEQRIHHERRELKANRKVHETSLSLRRERPCVDESTEGTISGFDIDSPHAVFVVRWLIQAVSRRKHAFDCAAASFDACREAIIVASDNRDPLTPW